MFVFTLLFSILLTTVAAPNQEQNDITFYLKKEPTSTLHHSPLNNFSLFIEPEDPYNRYAAKYTCRKNNEIVWSHVFPFTLYEVHVTDEGMILGYAYASIGKCCGDLHVVMIDQTGKVYLDDVYERQPGCCPETPANPWVLQMLIDSDNDRLILRIDDRDVNRPVESWWFYRLSTGKRLGPNLICVGKSDVICIHKAKIIPGTKLFVIHEYLKSMGDQFKVIDEYGKVYWRKAIVDKKECVILPNNNSKQFDIGISKDSQRITYKVEAEPGSKQLKKIIEIGRSKYVKQSDD